jgi:hypothetical protein
MTIRVSDNPHPADFGNEQFYDLADLIRDNSDDEEFMSVVDQLKAGETVCIAGGAWVAAWVRVRDDGEPDETA